jgi:hypothetical protein
MMNYTELKSNRQQFLARTGLTPEAFQRLRTAFQQTYERWFPPDLTRAGHPRQRLVGGGRKSSLESPEQKRLFILVYLKTYALPIVLGERFAMSQPRANPWIHRLLPIRREALDNGGVLPERTAGHFAPSQAGPGRPASSVDATERRRQRPQNPEKQALCYRGRKKKHGAKNVVIVPVRKQRVEFLSRTYAGKTHEKKIVDREGIVYPPGTVWYKDTGFQGYEPPVQNPGANTEREAGPSRAGEHSCPRGARPRRG